MATVKNIATPSVPTGDLPPEILFQPLEYGSDEAAKHVSGFGALLLAKHARAVARGATLLMQINQRDDFEMTMDASKPIFNGFHRGQFEDLVCAAADMLALEAARLIEAADKKLQDEREAA